MNQTKAHQELLKAILFKFGARRDMKIWANNTGATKTADGRFVRFGLVGSADILGLMKGGRFLAIEVKTGRAKQTPQQKKFEQMITDLGGLYILARSVEDVEKELRPYLSI